MDDTTTYAIDWKSLVCRNLRLYSGGTYVLTSTCTTSRKLFFGLLLLLLRLMRRHGFGKHVLFGVTMFGKIAPKKSHFPLNVQMRQNWVIFKHSDHVYTKIQSRAKVQKIGLSFIRCKASRCWIPDASLLSIYFFSTVAKAASLGSKKMIRNLVNHLVFFQK